MVQNLKIFGKIPRINPFYGVNGVGLEFTCTRFYAWCFTENWKILHHWPKPIMKLGFHYFFTTLPMKVSGGKSPHNVKQKTPGESAVTPPGDKDVLGSVLTAPMGAFASD